MAVKSGKGSASVKKNGRQKDIEANKHTAASSKQAQDGNSGFEDDDTETKTGKKQLSVTNKNDDNEMDNSKDEEDHLNKGEEDDEDWDPDFDEFDLPKSSKKVVPGKKSAKDNEDEFKVDEEFEDFLIHLHLKSIVMMMMIKR